jgi:hypothetical protein
MLSQARLALGAEASAAEQEYNLLIDQLEGVFGKNHKEVAAELQRIAKTIEEGGDVDAAFMFKQRTCEIMLKRNMELRRQNRSAPPVVPAPPVERLMVPQTIARLVGPLEYICMPVQDTRTAFEFYKRLLNAEQLFEHTVGSHLVAIKFAQGPAFLLIENSELKHCQPMFSTDDVARILAEFKKHDVTPALGPISTGLGSLYSFKDASGNYFAVIERRGRR